MPRVSPDTREMILGYCENAPCDKVVTAGPNRTYYMADSSEVRIFGDEITARGPVLKRLERMGLNGSVGGRK